MPVFALFFPIPIAVACTAVVHFANNVFRIFIVGRKADWPIVLAFGIPAAALVVPGAFLLVQISNINPLLTYGIATREFDITAVKLVVAGLILGFAAFDLIPSLRKVKFPRKWVPLGGALSGFLGGLSGHQGELRSVVLAKTGLETFAFVGTVSVCTFLVDLSGLAVYGFTFISQDFNEISQGNSLALVGVDTFAALIGTYVSSRFIEQVTMKTVRVVVGNMLVAIGLALASGLL